MVLRPSILLVAAAGCTEYEYSELAFTEKWTQPGDDAMADILFVIDDSDSMSEEQDRLADNFGAFTEALEDTYSDFQLGVTTTDPDRDGALVGAILTPDTPDLASAFLGVVTSVGTGGSRDEQGLAMALRAVGDGRNPGFVREDSNLNAVVLSDEDDHSPDSLSYYMAAMEEATGGGSFTAHAVVGDLPDGCASGVSAADPGERYLEAALVTGGYRDSICADDYSGILAKVGLEVAGLSDTFALQRIAEPGTITVWVDDVEMPEREADGWHYSSGENAIVFTGRAIPRPGMLVYAEYQLLAGTSEGGE